MAEKKRSRSRLKLTSSSGCFSGVLNCTDDGEPGASTAASTTYKEFRDSVLSTSGMVTRCTLHEGREFELFCETCGELICSHCIIKDQKHSSHRYDLISVCYDKFRGEIRGALKPMEQQLANVKRTISRVGICSSEITEQTASVESRIETTTKKIHEVLDTHKLELINQLHQVTRNKLASLETQVQQLESLQTRLSHSLEIMKKSIEEGEQGELLMMKRALTKHVDTVTAAIKPEMFVPFAEADIVYTAPSNITSMRCGELLLEKSLHPSKIFVDNKKSEVAVGVESTVTLTVNRYSGTITERDLQSLKYKLESLLNDTKVTGKVEVLKGKEYCIRYKPPVKGRHQLSILFNNEHIVGSPFTVTAILPISHLGLGRPIGKVDGVEDPFSVAVTGKDELVVVERARHLVMVFNLDEKTHRVIGCYGGSVGQFHEPNGVAVDRDGNIIVSDRGNGRIQKFSPEGSFISSVGTREAGLLQFTLLRAIAYNHRNGKVYVLDDNRVKILNSDFTFSGIFGKEGSARGQFNSPWGIACDSLGRVLVADSRNHRVQIFSTDGKFLKMFGKVGGGKGELRHPVGIAVDSKDKVYVTDSDVVSNRLCVFTPEGQFVAMFGRKGKEPGEFVDPRGVAVDSSGIVYVCDYGNSRIQMF